MILQDRTGTHPPGLVGVELDRPGRGVVSMSGAASPRRESDVAWPGEGRRMPTGEGSITHYLGGLRTGDEAAVRAVMDRYRDPLEAYARRLLRGYGASRAVEDEQDLAHEAILIVVVGIRREKYKDLHDREALIRLLQTVTRRQALKLKRYQEASRRTGHPRAPAGPDGTSDLLPSPEASGGGATGERPQGPGPGVGLRWEWGAEELIAHVAGRERTPDEVFRIREEMRAVLDALEDERDREILRLKLEGYTHTEIAQRLDCCKRTISLRFQLVCSIIRKLADEHGRPLD
jgi:RNA polymerase sigma factor (sigma-70 family)